MDPWLALITVFQTAAILGLVLLARGQRLLFRAQRLRMDALSVRLDLLVMRVDPKALPSGLPVPARGEARSARAERREAERLFYERHGADGVPRFQPVFRSPYQQYRERNGQSFEVLGPVTHATHPTEVDEEVGRLWHIRFADGQEIWAWPEEIEELVA